ncbi:MAG: NAD(P)/FAD-dependent oxidoreductase [Pseudomonadota bacterium]
MDRRKFLGLMAASGLGLASLPIMARADDDEGSATPRLFPVPTNTGLHGHIVVVGGGMAGAAVTKYLRLWGGTGVNVTLIEKSPVYTSNILSNTVLTGQRTLTSLNYAYDVLEDHYGVMRRQGEVVDVDPAARRVYLADGGNYPYDRLVLAPGLDFDLLPGMTSLTEYDTRIPHAWKAGPQTQLLREQLMALVPGQPVVMTLPLAPYRCPPGPYERACVIADWLKVNKPGSKVIVLDANASILVEPENFAHAFNVTHAGVVDYRPGSTVTDIDSAALTLSYTRNGVADSLTAGVINPIPPQRAPQLLADLGLCNSANGRFARVDVRSYESTAQAGIHVIGDASDTPQPKAGHIGNQQGKTCADAILRALAGQGPDPSPVTNSACYTPITATTATWLSAVYQYDAASGKMVIPAQHNGGKPISASAATSGNYRDMLRWFDTLMGDTFS